jgi:small subunit ribosomal protein S6
MLLCDARRDDAEIEQTLGRFTALVTERGGEVGGVDKWGRRKLAYEIEDIGEGYYAVFTYTLPTDKRADLEAALPFVEGLVRSKTIRRDLRERRVKA